MCDKKKLRTAGKMLQNITSTILSLSDNCSMPCQVTYVTLNNIPSPINENKTRTFTFKFNPINMMTKSIPIYTLWDYIGEFGIIDLFDQIVVCWTKIIRL